MQERLKISLDYSSGIIILGKRGAGKTTLAKFIIKSVPYQVVILDCMGRYRDLQKYQNRIAVYPVNPYQPQTYEQILEKCYLHGNLWVVIDEIDQYPFLKAGNLQKLVNVARNWGIGYLVVSRDTAYIHKAWLRNSNYSFIFYHFEDLEVKRITRNYAVIEADIKGLKPYEFLVFKDNSLIEKYKLDLPP